MDLIEQEGSRYKGIVEFGIGDSRQSPLSAWIEDIKSIPGVKSVVSSQSGLYTMSMAVPRQNGEKNDLLMLELYEKLLGLPRIYTISTCWMPNKHSIYYSVPLCRSSSTSPSFAILCPKEKIRWDNRSLNTCPKRVRKVLLSVS